jgi:hypothetical protein
MCGFFFVSAPFEDHEIILSPLQNKNTKTFKLITYKFFHLIENIMEVQPHFPIHNRVIISGNK